MGRSARAPVVHDERVRGSCRPKSMSRAPPLSAKDILGYLPVRQICSRSSPLASHPKSADACASSTQPTNPPSHNNAGAFSMPFSKSSALSPWLRISRRAPASASIPSSTVLHYPPGYSTLYRGAEGPIKYTLRGVPAVCYAHT